MPEDFVYDASKIFTLETAQMAQLQRLWTQFQQGLMTPEEYASEVNLVVTLARVDWERGQEVL